jgi:hypothetical protein
MTTEQVHQLLEMQHFIFAKTRPNNPHFYTLAKNWNSREDFEFVVQFIRDNCTVEYFYKKPYQVYYLNGWKYWTMGFPLEQTILINRAKL